MCNKNRTEIEIIPGSQCYVMTFCTTADDKIHQNLMFEWKYRKLTKPPHINPLKPKRV
jgi:hypothetical protein